MGLPPPCYCVLYMISSHLLFIGFVKASTDKRQTVGIISVHGSSFFAHYDPILFILLALDYSITDRRDCMRIERSLLS